MKVEKCFYYLFEEVNINYVVKMNIIGYRV